MFWSPDSKFLGFTARDAIHRIGVDGGPPVPITTVERYAGAQWTADGAILYGRTLGGMMKVPASGGPLIAVTELDPTRDETGHIAPVMLPDGRRFLYVRVSRNPQQSGVFAGSLDTAPGSQSTKPLLPFRTLPLISHSPDGVVHALFVRDGTLLAQKLDLASMTLSEPATVIAEEVGNGLGSTPIVSAAGGTIAFRPPDAPGGGTPTWFDRDGRRLGPAFAKAVPRLQLPQLSPDGTRLAAIVGRNLWVYPLDGRPPIRLTMDGSLSPLWTPDGQSIVYERYGAVNGLHVIAADGSSSVPRPLGPPGHLHAHGVLPNGRGVLAALESPESPGMWSLVEVPWSGSEAPVQVGDIVLRTPAVGAALSPDGRWLAYIANTTGNAELWVRRYPTLDAAVRISPNGATEPVWSKDGRELSYFEGDRLMRVRVGPEANGRLSFAPPVVVVVQTSFLRAPQPPSFDVTADGRLLLLERLPDAAPAPIEVIINWDHAARRTSQ
jgi:Tol biopolymer transport system component